MSDTQNEKILKHLKAGGTITSLKALREFGCMRLASRIYDLRRKGHLIEGETIKVKGARVKKYWLKGE